MSFISERERELPRLEFPKIFSRVINDHSVISLGPGEPDFVTPRPLLKYAKSILKKSTHYADPQGMITLREAICNKVKKENRISASPENVLVTCGSQEALFASLLATIDPTEEVLIPSPGYVGYLPAIELVSGVPVQVKLEEKNNFEFDSDVLKKSVSRKSKVLIINSPSNPTGTVLSKRNLEEIASFARNHKLVVITDEAYEKIVYDKKHVSLASLNGMDKYVITLQTFSKSFAMCGFRLGYAVGPQKLIKEMNKAHHYMTLSAPHASQMMGIKALSLPKKYTNKMVNEYRVRRDVLVKRLNHLSLRTKVPDGAFYTFSNISHYSKNSSKFAKLLLDKANVAVIPGTEFGKFGEGFIRCSFATDLKKINLALDNIEKVLR